MITATFEYHRPATLAETIGLLQRYGGEAKLLSGGHSLLPMMKLGLAEPPALIDVSNVPELTGIRRDGGDVVIGAATRHFQLLTSAIVQQGAPLLAEAASLVGDQQVRNRGTIGGSLSHSDPGADLPAAVLAAGGSVRVQGPGGSRTIAIDDLFVELMTTALSPDEVLVEVRVPTLTAGQGSAYEKFPQPASRFAIAGVAAVVTLSGDTITKASVALTGAGPKASRLTGVEQALAGQPVSAIAAASAHAAHGWEPNEDIHASGEYRQHLATVLTRRALDRAVAVARGQASNRFGLL